MVPIASTTPIMPYVPQAPQLAPYGAPGYGPVPGRDVFLPTMSYVATMPPPVLPAPMPAAPAAGGLVVLLRRLFASLFGFLKPQPAPDPLAGVVIPERSQLSDEAFVADLYQRLLGRQPDPEGFQSHLSALARGVARQEVLRGFLHSPEYLARQAAPAPSPAPQPLPQPAPQPAPPPALPPGARAPLSTVPLKPEYAAIALDRSSDAAAVRSAAAWVKQHHPEYFNQGDSRPVALAMMGTVIGILRTHGYDAGRVVNYPDRPVGDPGRYGKDALHLNGTIWDVYGGWGDPNASTPQSLDVGPYGARPME